MEFSDIVKVLIGAVTMAAGWVFTVWWGRRSRREVSVETKKDKEEASIHAKIDRHATKLEEHAGEARKHGEKVMEAIGTVSREVGVAVTRMDGLFSRVDALDENHRHLHDEVSKNREAVSHLQGAVSRIATVPGMWSPEYTPLPQPLPAMPPPQPRRTPSYPPPRPAWGRMKAPGAGTDRHGPAVGLPPDEDEKTEPPEDKP